MRKNSGCYWRKFWRCRSALLLHKHLRSG